MIETCNGVSWVKERSGILIVNHESGGIHLLQGFQACLWDWMQLMSWSDVIDLCAVFLRSSKEKTRDEVSVVFTKWQQLGIVQYAGEGHDQSSD